MDLTADQPRREATMTRPPSPTSPVALEAKNDPRVQTALRHLANAAVELHLSLAALGADHPRLGSAIMTLFPGLAEEAIKDGRSRVTIQKDPR